MSNKTLICTLVAVTSLASVAAFGQTKSSANLSLDLTGLDFNGSRATGTMYMPNGVDLSETKPAGITKEPTYKGTPQYGILKLGNGPHTRHLIAIDAPSDGSDAKIYVDVKGDGDLTQSNAGWTKKLFDGGSEYHGTLVFFV